MCSGKPGLDNVVGISLADPAANSKLDDLVEITIGRNSVRMSIPRPPSFSSIAVAMIFLEFFEQEERNAGCWRPLAPD